MSDLFLGLRGSLVYESPASAFDIMITYPYARTRAHTYTHTHTTKQSPNTGIDIHFPCSVDDRSWERGEEWDLVLDAFGMLLAALADSTVDRVVRVGNGAFDSAVRVGDSTVDGAVCVGNSAVDSAVDVGNDSSGMVVATLAHVGKGNNAFGQGLRTRNGRIRTLRDSGTYRRRSEQA